jgi:hypothetical protein
VWVEDFLIGTGGNPIAGLLEETTTRLTAVGFTTDPTQLIDISAVDVNPCTGEETLRLLATTDPSTQPVLGRFVHRVLGGLFTPPTREYVVSSHAGVMSSVANGIDAGQYRLPNFEYIFPENHNLGDPLIPFNFEDMPFLAQGSGPLFGAGPLVSQLDPWPGASTPAALVCTATGALPIVSAGADFTVSGGAQVTLTGTVTQDPNASSPAITWTQPGGPLMALANANTLTPAFSAPTLTPGTSTTLTFTMAATDQFGTGTASVNVTVTQPTDILAVAAATWKQSAGGKKTGKLTVTATSNNAASALTLIEIDAVTGAPIPLGTLTATGNPVGTFSFSSTGIHRPSQLFIHSTNGGSVTAVCGPPSATGVVTCQ